MGKAAINQVENSKTIAKWGSFICEVALVNYTLLCLDSKINIEKVNFIFFYFFHEIVETIHK